MILKKCNALCSWFLTMSLLGHLGTMSFSMLTGWYSYTVCKALAHVTMVLAVLHISASLILVCFFHDGASFHHYKKKNRRVILQRATAAFSVLPCPMKIPTLSSIGYMERIGFRMHAKTERCSP